ncbi:MAG TPA: hypothetical protein VK096_04670 [Actinomycetales bacterium]|nr:hypothetical protein [Actinomycetales bacterium]
MSPWMWWAIALVVVILIWLITGLASRLDRLHHRIAAASTALDAQLVRRASAALELVRLGVLDPAATLVIAESAARVLDMDGLSDPERELAESELSQALRAGLSDEEFLAEIADGELGSSVVGALASAWVRAEMARRFHNDAVSHTRRIRRKILVRLLRLAGRAPMPVMIELDDDLPAGLGVYDVRAGF